MKKIALIAGAIVILLVPALPLADRGHGVALLVYILVAVGVALALLIDFLSKALPRKTFAWSPQARPWRAARPIVQFERIERALVAASWNESHLHETLRPLVREILAARLRRRYRIDLDRAPERAHAVVGDGYAWSLARPERKPPLGAGGRGWSRDELDNLLDELEAL
ncbi:MAG: hypothetical protein ACYDHO_01655 [Gaiellaceae bacterium]